MIHSALIHSSIVRSATKTKDWCHARGVVIVQALEEAKERVNTNSTLMLPSQVDIPAKEAEVAILHSMIEKV